MSVKEIKGCFRGPFQSTVEEVVRKHTENYQDEILVLHVEWLGSVEYELSCGLTKSQLEELEAGSEPNPSPFIPLKIVGYDLGDLRVKFLFYSRK